MTWHFMVALELLRWRTYGFTPADLFITYKAGVCQVTLEKFSAVDVQEKPFGWLRASLLYILSLLGALWLFGAN